MSENKPGEQGSAGEIDYKAELEKLKAENEKLVKTNEDMRLEFMGDDYLNFLEAKNKPVQKEERKPESQGSDDLLNNLTPKQAYELALKKADEIAESKVKKLQDDLANESKTRTKQEVQKFFANNPDAEKYRPVMYGMATDPKHADKDLDDLYKLAKAHVKSLNEGPTEEEKNKSRKSQGEKPGFGNNSFAPGAKKLSASEAAEKAWEETAGKSGLF